MPRDPLLPKSVTITIRIDPESLDILEWWAKMSVVPLRSMMRSALEDIADDILAQYHADADERLPDGVLLRKFRHRLGVEGNDP